jgi:hypothetical protein
MQSPQPSKQFRWVGRPSEEELLGTLESATPHAAVRFLPTPPPSPKTAEPAPADEQQPRRSRARDLLMVAGLGTAAWLAWHGAGIGLPFLGSEPARAAEAADPAPGRVTVDRRELVSLERAAAPQEARPERAKPTGGSTRGDGSSGGNGSSGGGQDPKPTPPPGGGDDPPLLQATVPGVGTVTVEQPDAPLPEAAPTVPDLPDVGALLPDTSTLALP